MTDTQPKCYATVGGRRILDWALEAFDRAGLREKTSSAATRST
jgi:NDP-sugar pyrophosphorylase family protein